MNQLSELLAKANLGQQGGASPASAGKSSSTSTCKPSTTVSQTTAGNPNTKPAVANSGHSDDHGSTASGSAKPSSGNGMPGTKPMDGSDRKGSDFSPTKGGLPPGQAKQGDCGCSGKDGMPMQPTNKPLSSPDKTGMPGSSSDQGQTNSGMPGAKPMDGNNGNTGKGGVPPGQAKQGDCGCPSKDGMPMQPTNKPLSSPDKTGMPGSSSDQGQTNSGMPGTKPMNGNNGQGNNSSPTKDGVPPGQSKQGDCNCTCHQGNGQSGDNKPGNQTTKQPGTDMGKGSGDTSQGQGNDHGANSGTGANSDVVAFDLKTLGEMVGALYGNNAGSYVRDIVSQDMKHGFIDAMELSTVLTDIKAGHGTTAEIAHVAEHSPLLNIVLVGISPTDTGTVATA